MTGTHTCVYMYTDIYVYMCIYTYVCACVRTHKHIMCIYTHICMHVDTRTHAHTYLPAHRATAPRSLESFNLRTYYPSTLLNRGRVYPYSLLIYTPCRGGPPLTSQNITISSPGLRVTNVFQWFLLLGLVSPMFFNGF